MALASTVTPEPKGPLTSEPVAWFGPVQAQGAPLDALNCVVPVVAVKLTGALVFHVAADAAPTLTNGRTDDQQLSICAASPAPPAAT